MQYFPLFIKYAVRAVDGKHVIDGLEIQVQEKDEQLAEKDEQLAEKDEQLAEKDEQLLEKDKQLAEKDKQLAEKDKQLMEKDQIINEQNKYIVRVKNVVLEPNLLMDKKNKSHAPDTNRPMPKSRPEINTPHKQEKGQVEIVTQELQKKTLQGSISNEAKVEKSGNHESGVFEEMGNLYWYRDDRDEGDDRRI